MRTFERANVSCGPRDEANQRQHLRQGDDVGADLFVGEGEGDGEDDQQQPEVKAQGEEDAEKKRRPGQNPGRLRQRVDEERNGEDGELLPGRRLAIGAGEAANGMAQSALIQGKHPERNGASLAK